MRKAIAPRKAKGQFIKQDQQAQRSTARRVYRQQSKSDGEDDDGPAPAPRPRRMLSEAQLLALVPLSRTSIWRMEKAGTFPRSTYISKNRRIWYEDQITRWQSEIDARDPHRRRGPGRPKRSEKREQPAPQQS